MKTAIFSIILGIVTLYFMTGCSDDAINYTESKKQLASQAEMLKQVAPPHIVNWREKKECARMYELRDRTDLVMYVYTQDMTGKMHYRGKCLGFPLPYATQFNAPHSYLDSNTGHDQAEPNGLFPPSAAEGTMIEKIYADGSTGPAYIEDRIQVFSHLLTPEEMQ